MSSFFRRRIEQLATSAGVALNAPGECSLVVNNDAFYRRVLWGGSLALGESYMDGWWDCNDLHRLFCRLLEASSGKFTTLPLRERLDGIIPPLSNRQSLTRARQVVDVHYEVPLNVFEAMLDARMVYSCGYWRNADCLDVAQEQKLDLICRKLQLSEQDVLLDIGCGFGGLLKYAAERYGCYGLGITNSPQQGHYAQRNCGGLPIQIRIDDYRSLRQGWSGLDRQITKVASVGMFEHVGPANYRSFAQIVTNLLPDGGLMLLQTIGDNRSRYRCDPWLEKYIFPNGVAPSPKQLTACLDGICVIEDWHNFGPDYATTLLSWAARFAASYERTRDLSGNGSERFRRMWHYYLHSFASAFTVRQLQLWQIVWSKGRRAGTYVSTR